MTTTQMQSLITFSVQVHYDSRGGSTTSLVVDTKLPHDLILHGDSEINQVLLQLKLQDQRRELHNILCDVQTIGVVELYAYEKFFGYSTHHLKKINITDIDVTDIKMFVFAIKSGTHYSNIRDTIVLKHADVFKFLIGLTKAGYSYQVVDAHNTDDGRPDVYHEFVKILVNKPNTGVDLLL
jgi:hypothetical protein